MDFHDISHYVGYAVFAGFLVYMLYQTFTK